MIGIMGLIINQRHNPSVKILHQRAQRRHQIASHNQQRIRSGNQIGRLSHDQVVQYLAFQGHARVYDCSARLTEWQRCVAQYIVRIIFLPAARAGILIDIPIKLYHIPAAGPPGQIQEPSGHNTQKPSILFHAFQSKITLVRLASFLQYFFPVKFVKSLGPVLIESAGKNFIRRISVF